MKKKDDELTMIWDVLTRFHLDIYSYKTRSPGIDERVIYVNIDYYGLDDRRGMYILKKWEQKNMIELRNFHDGWITEEHIANIIDDLFRSLEVSPPK